MISVGRTRQGFQCLKGYKPDKTVIPAIERHPECQIEPTEGFNSEGMMSNFNILLMTASDVERS
jgi:hypothetical protein